MEKIDKEENNLRSIYELKEEWGRTSGNYVSLTIIHCSDTNIVLYDKCMII